jgi:hypothetical protein
VAFGDRINPLRSGGAPARWLLGISEIYGAPEGRNNIIRKIQKDIEDYMRWSFVPESSDIPCGMNFLYDALPDFQYNG